MKMTQRHKKFILNRLIPAIMREGGRGFAMEWWYERLAPKGKLVADRLPRVVPKCGTVCCIGGTIQMLCGNQCNDADLAGAKLGLSPDRARVLFYGWEGQEDGVMLRYSVWPDKYVKAYKKSKTCRGKAGVACRLLREVVETEGRCLDV